MPVSREDLIRWVGLFIYVCFLFLVWTATPGCSLIEGNAGQARYSMEPVIHGDQIVCCKVDIRNAKDIGKVKASVTKLEDGTYEISLEEEGVNSSAPMGVMMQQNQLMMEMLLKTLPGS